MMNSEILLQRMVTGNEKLEVSAVTNVLHCVVTAQAEMARPLKSHMPVDIEFDGSSFTGSVILIGVNELGEGQRCFCLIRLNERIECRCGTSFDVTDRARHRAAGSGTVLACGLPGTPGAGTSEILSLLECIVRNDIGGALTSALRLYHPNGVSVSHLSQAFGISEKTVVESSEASSADIISLSKDKLLMDKNDIEYWTGRIIRAVKEYHIEHPHDAGPDFESLISVLKPHPAKAVLESVLSRMVADGIIVIEDSCYQMHDFKAQPDDPLEGLRGDVFSFYDDAEYSAPRLRDAAKALKQPEMRVKGVLKNLGESGYITKLDRDTYLSKTKLKDAMEIALRLISENDGLDLGEFRDRIGCSRSMALRMLEYFDKKGWTERRSGIRVKGAKEPKL
jgi:hypothetical protein